MPITISFTTFVDFAAATGAGKVRQVRDARELYGHAYTTFTDYWADLRKAITALHEHDNPPSTLDSVLAVVSEQKQANYAACITAYKRWLRRAKPTNVGVRYKKAWRTDDLVVSVNPELHVDLNGNPNVIKLYFRSAPVTRTRLDVSLYLLQQSAGNAARAGILDVRRGKLHLASPLPARPGMDALLLGEADLFVRIWNSL